MTIFSRKQSVKKSDEPAKVILDDSLGGKAAERAATQVPTSETAKTSGSSESTARESLPYPGSLTVAHAATAPADPAAPTPIQPEPSHELIDPEPIITPGVAPVEKRFGIDDAILLMRSLPADPNAALVVRVVRVTLGAVNVSIEEIVEDAVRKETRIKESISRVESQIADLEKQLAGLRKEIATYQADLKETVSVRERLHLADQYPGLKPPPAPIANPLPRTTSTKSVIS